MVAKVIPFPIALAPVSMTERLHGNTNVFFSELNKIPTTTENPGARWGFDLDYSEIDGYSLRGQNVGAAISRLRGQAVRMHCHSLARPNTTGSLDTANKVGNGDFSLGGSGWSKSEGAGSKVGLEGGRARLDKGTGEASVSRTISVTSGETYSMGVSVYEGSGDSVTMTVGSSNDTFTGGGRHASTFTASGSSITVTVANNTNNTVLSVGDIIVARAATVSGAQTGSTILITGLGSSSDNAINPMDWISINGELKRVVEPCMSNSGSGRVTFEPPLRASAPNGSAVVLHSPFAKFILNGESSPMSTSAPYFTSYTLSLLEDTSL